MEKTDSDLNVPFILHQKFSVFLSMSESTPIERCALPRQTCTFCLHGSTFQLSSHSHIGFKLQKTVHPFLTRRVGSAGVKWAGWGKMGSVD